MYGEANINGVLKNSRLRWTGHVWKSEESIEQNKKMENNQKMTKRIS